MLDNIYTTKMSANKKTMENRFSKIRSSNTRIHKVMATLMTVAVIITMLCANVVMAMVDEKTSEQYVIEVKKAETILDYYNKPFIENDTVYFPLRETFEKFGIMENKDSYINWDNGKIDICIAWSDNSDYAKEAHSQLNNGNGVDVITLLHYYRIEIGKNILTYNTTKNLAGQDISSPKSMNSAPLLRNGITYVPFEYLKGFNVSRSFMELNFTIKDINGNDLYSIPYIPMKSVVFSNDSSRQTLSFEIADFKPDFIKRNLDTLLSAADFSEPYTYDISNREYDDNNNEIIYTIDLTSLKTKKEYYAIMIFENIEGVWKVRDASFGDGFIWY